MNKVLFIDTLTTGMQQGRCGLWGIGGILAEWTTEKTTEILRFDFRMRPNDNVRIDDKFLWIGRNTRTSLLAYEDEKTVLDRFTNLLKKEININNPKDKIILSGYNSSSLDLPFIREWFERNGNKRFRDYFHVQTLDIMCLCAFALAGERTNMENFHRETVARHMGVLTRQDEQYNCVENAETCMKIFRNLNEKLKTGDHGEESTVTELIKNF